MVKDLTMKYKLGIGCLYIILFCFFIIYFVQPCSKKISLDRIELRKQHFENFTNTVSFTGEVIDFVQLDSRHRGIFLYCVQINNLNIDSSKIINDNIFNVFEGDFIGIGISSSIIRPNTSLRKNVKIIDFNSKGNGKFFMHDSNNDSLDVTRWFHALYSSEANIGCLKGM